MSIMLASTDTLQVVLASAPATNQLPVNVSYVDQGGSGGNQPTTTTGTTAVTVVPSPASGVERLVSHVSIPNIDTAAVTVTVNVVRSGTAHEECKITLPVGYRLGYDERWHVIDANGNFLCNVTVTGGTLTANQGTAAALSGAWPVEVTDGTNVLGTSSHPIRTDPTGTTTQPVSVSNFPADQNVNLAQLDGSALAGPTAWGTAPASGAQVLNVNANIVAGGGGGGGNVNVTEWNSQALGSPTTYGTPPTGESVIGVNAFVTNTVPVTGTFFQTTQPVSGTVTANQGTSPWVVSLASTTITGTVAATQSGTWTVQPGNTANTTPWLVTANAGTGIFGTNVAQYGGTATSLGQKVSASSVPVAIASDQSALGVNCPVGVLIRTDLVSTAAAVNTMNSTRTRVYGIAVYANAVILAAGSVILTLKDGSGNTIYALTIPTGVSTALSGLLVDGLNTSNIALVNGGASPTYSLSANLTSGSFIVVTQFM